MCNTPKKDRPAPNQNSVRYKHYNARYEHHESLLESEKKLIQAKINRANAKLAQGKFLQSDVSAI